MRQQSIHGSLSRFFFHYIFFGRFACFCKIYSPFYMGKWKANNNWCQTGSLFLFFCAFVFSCIPKFSWHLFAYFFFWIISMKWIQWIMNKFSLFCVRVSFVSTKSLVSVFECVNICANVQTIHSTTEFHFVFFFLLLKNKVNTHTHTEFIIIFIKCLTHFTLFVFFISRETQKRGFFMPNLNEIVIDHTHTWSGCLSKSKKREKMTADNV